ncbi:hypothetical protein ACP70R_024905 [Stipagrostis hirtigluma subsp. patula]
MEHLFSAPPAPGSCFERSRSRWSRKKLLHQLLGENRYTYNSTSVDQQNNAMADSMREKEDTTSEDFYELKKKIDEMNAKLKETCDELQDAESITSCLIKKERKMNGELNKAKRELIEGLREVTRSQSNIGVKQMGCLDQEVFLNACKLKGANGDTEIEAKRLCSPWQNEISGEDSGWYPFKVISIDGGGTKGEIINDDDGKLVALKEEWGIEAYNAVVRALAEYHEYNPARGPSVLELWNFSEDRKASIAEAVETLGEALEGNKGKYVST